MYSLGMIETLMDNMKTAKLIRMANADHMIVQKNSDELKIIVEDFLQ